MFVDAYRLRLFFLVADFHREKELSAFNDMTVDGQRAYIPTSVVRFNPLPIENNLSPTSPSSLSYWSLVAYASLNPPLKHCGGKRRQRGWPHDCPSSPLACNKLYWSAMGRNLSLSKWCMAVPAAASECRQSLHDNPHIKNKTNRYVLSLAKHTHTKRKRENLWQHERWDGSDLVVFRKCRQVFYAHALTTTPSKINWIEGIRSIDWSFGRRWVGWDAF